MIRISPCQFIQKGVAEVTSGIGHVGTQRENLGGAYGGVFQWWDPTRYKLHCSGDVIVSDVVIEDILFVDQFLTVQPYKEYYIIQ